MCWCVFVCQSVSLSMFANTPELINKSFLLFFGEGPGLKKWFNFEKDTDPIQDLIIHNFHTSHFQYILNDFYFLVNIIL